MVIKAEGGLKRHRLEWVQESTQGEAPADPAWNLFSDTVRSFDWSPDTQIETTFGIGDAEPSAFLKGPEQHEFTVVYDLQQKSSGNTLVNGSTTEDASYDGLQRDVDNLLQASHTIVDREYKSSLTAEETVNGTTSKDSRLYTVLLGCLHDEVTYTLDPGSQQPVQVEITYQVEKGRTYQIDQPGSAVELDVVSSSANDTTQTLTIEDEGAGTSTTVALNGTTTVATTGTTFSDIDALSLDAETEGDITISETGADDLAVIYGSASYQGVEGDLGVPALGTSGSHASALGTDFEIVIGDTITRAGTNLAFDINSAELSVSNSIERTNRIDKLSQRLHAGQHDLMLTATVLGESESHDQLLDHLQVNESNIVWTMTGQTVQLDNAVLTGPGSRSIEAGQAVMTLDSEFQGKDLTIS